MKRTGNDSNKESRLDGKPYMVYSNIYTEAVSIEISKKKRYLRYGRTIP